MGTQGELVFDTAWIKVNSGIGTRNQTNRIFYFEIPVNKGEYALGSVSGGYGAYLLYLDIGANAQTVNRVTTIENFTENVATYEFPVGVTFTNAKTGDVYIPSTIGSMATSKNTVTVTVEADGSITADGVTIGYFDENITVTDTVGNTISLSGTAITSKVRRVTYYDYNIALDRYTITEVVTKQPSGGAKTVTINAWTADKTWTKGTQIATMTEGFTPNNGTNTPSVAINKGQSQILEYKNVESKIYYLINISNESGAETLRLDPNAFEGELTLGTKIYAFFFHTYGDYSIDYNYQCKAATQGDPQTFTIGNRTYTFTVTAKQDITIKSNDSSSDSTITINDVVVKVDNSSATP